MPEQIIAQPLSGSVKSIATDGARVWFFRRTFEDAREDVDALVSCANGAPCETPTVHGTTSRAGRLWIDGDFVFSHRDDRVERIRRDATGTTSMETVIVVSPENRLSFAHLPGVILHRAIRGGRSVVVRCPAGPCDLATAPVVLEADMSAFAASATRIFYIDRAKIVSAPLEGGSSSVRYEAAQPLWGALVADGEAVFALGNDGLVRIE
jgi:hypothetical protein